MEKVVQKTRNYNIVEHFEFRYWCDDKQNTHEVCE